MNNKERKLDELLNNALADYSNVEPRAGLEGRILANLATMQPETGSRFRWWPAMGLAAAAAMALVLFLAAPHEIRKPATLGVKSPVSTSPAVIPEVATEIQASRPHMAGNSSRHLHGPVRPAHVEYLAASHPAQLAVVKQDVFPAPSPLTSQEKMLFAYLRRTPATELVGQTKPDDTPDVFQPTQNRVQNYRPTDSNAAR